MGLAHSTSQIIELFNYAAPVNLAVSGDGRLAAVTLSTARRANVIFYDFPLHRVVSSTLVPGTPAGVALAADGNHAWIVSASAEAITEITEKSATRTEYPKSASTSPLLMIAVNESTRRAYTTGALTFPEVDLDQHQIIRRFELPTNSAGIALSPDGAVAYLTFADADKIGVLNLRDMSSYKEIKLR
jgi:DNA-binding beta-propeller fold protein YncE